MKRLLIVGILIVSIGPLFAQAQPDPAKLTADARKVVGIIDGDKAKVLHLILMAPDRVRTHFRSPLFRRCADRYKERAVPRAMRRFDFSASACRVVVGALRSGSAGHWTSAVSSDGSVSGSKADGSGTGSVLSSAAIFADVCGQLANVL